MTGLDDEPWLALGIGNSRNHWGAFRGNTLHHTWHTPHLSSLDNVSLDNFSQDFLSQTLPLSSPHPWEHYPKIRCGSVVPTQTAFWSTYPHFCLLTLADIPIQNLYSTLGIDRALTLWGAGETRGWPVLVIDGGTALTFTGADEKGCFVGGAILPGLSLQLRALSQGTAVLPALPRLNTLPLPQRWANQTSEAIYSGVLYTLLAGIADFIQEWWGQFPTSPVVLTGGDHQTLLTALHGRSPTLASQLCADPHLLLWGIRAHRALNFPSSSAQTGSLDPDLSPN